MALTLSPLKRTFPLLLTLLSLLQICLALPSEFLKSADNNDSVVSTTTDTRPISSSTTNSINTKNSSSLLKSDDLGPAALLYVVKNSNLQAWLEEQGPDAFLTRGNSVLYLHRARRQDPSQASSASAPTSVWIEPTPVLPLTGEKEFNATDCMPWYDAAAIVGSSLKPKHKSLYLEPLTCRIDQGLECVPVGDKDFMCKCMLIYGPKAIFINYTDNLGRLNYHCFIPAGRGYSSECQGKEGSTFGFPLPFGDPQGRNIQHAAETDAFNKQDGTQIIVDYIRWNSIMPKCPPFAECREQGTYIGQRCQCQRGHKLDKNEGTCNTASHTLPKQDRVVKQLIASLIGLLLPKFVTLKPLQ